MARRIPHCRRYAAAGSVHHNSLTAGGYLAAVRVDELPRPMRREDHRVLHGYAVGFGQWFFFEDIAPAVAFGRAARMSFECSGYGVFAAAHDLMFCDQHRVDERVLLITGDNVDREPDEVEHLKRFVQGVKEHPWSSSWHPPTGFITEYNRGNPITTRRRSLPL